MNKYIEQSGYVPAIRLERIFSSAVAGATAILSLVLAFVVLFASVLLENEKLLGLSLVLMAGVFVFLIYWLFLSYLERDREFSVGQIAEARKNGLYGINLTYFSAFLLNASSEWESFFPKRFFLVLFKKPQFLWILRRLNILEKEFAEAVRKNYPDEYSLPLEVILRLASDKAHAANHLRVRYSDLLVALCDMDEICKKMMFNFEVEERDIESVAYWQRRLESELQQQGRFWDEHNLLDIQGIGKHWSSGYTVFLDRITYDISQNVRYNRPPRHLYGRRREVLLLQQMLLQGSGNAVLVGLPGSGRSTIVRVFADAVNKGFVAGPLRYKRVLQIDSSAIVSGAASANDVVEKIKMLFGEAYQSGDVILFVNNIDAFLDASPEAGRVNAAEALLPFLKSQLSIIGITTPVGYQNTIGRNTQLSEVFGKIEIDEPSDSETLFILQDEVPDFEKRTGVFFVNSALLEIVKLTKTLIQNLPNPEKSLGTLEEAANYAASRKNTRVITPEDIQTVLEARTKVPLHRVKGKERDVLLNLEAILHERIIGQNVAVSELAGALRRARSGIRPENRPIGSFLFLGPTGVGKTETARTLAAIYFGDEKRMIRFDMSEYQELHNIDRLIGNADTGEGGQLTEAVIANPFSLILLDELEKAHPKLLDIFLQILDEGRLTDSNGRTVNFANTMIIATSNAGAREIREMVRSGKDLLGVKDELLDKLMKQGIFRPEFVNRFDAIVIYKPLSEVELSEVARLQLEELNRRLKEKDIQLIITPELTRAVAKGGYDPEFGARPLRRFIQEKIENYIAQGLISGNIKRGDTVEITPEMIEKETME